MEVLGEEDDESLIWPAGDTLSWTSSGKFDTEDTGDFFKIPLNFDPSFDEAEGDEGFSCFLSLESRVRDEVDTAPAMITGICR